MTRAIIHTDLAPQAIGPYSQAVKCGNTVYLTGQIPFDPATGELVKGDIEVQVRRVFDNLLAVIKAAGGDFSNIAKLNIYLTDLNNFAVVNKLMSEYFAQPYPARTTLGVASLPRNAVVEMDAIAEL